MFVRHITYPSIIIWQESRLRSGIRSNTWRASPVAYSWSWSRHGKGVSFFATWHCFSVMPIICLVNCPREVKDIWLFTLRFQILIHCVTWQIFYFIHPTDQVMWKWVEAPKSLLLLCWSKRCKLQGIRSSSGGDMNLLLWQHFRWRCKKKQRRRTSSCPPSNPSGPSTLQVTLRAGISHFEKALVRIRQCTTKSSIRFRFFVRTQGWGPEFILGIKVIKHHHWLFFDMIDTCLLLQGEAHCRYWLSTHD